MRCVGLLAMASGVAACFSKPPAPYAGDGGSKADTAPPANYMFVTSNRFPASSLASAALADQHCMDAAASGGLPGTYVAWWSSASLGIAARDRLANRRGWVRVDAAPFADTVSDLTTGRIFTPPRIDEHGIDLWSSEADALVYTGTDASGAPSGSDCASGVSVSYGIMDATTEHWTTLNGRTTGCTVPLRLYCFGIDHSIAVSPPPIPVGGKIAFVTSMPIAIDAAQGTTAWDTHCNTAGAQLGLARNYKAFVARESSSARSIFTPSSSGEWYRPDGIKVADTPSFTSFRVPLNVTERSEYIVGTVFTGATDFNSAAQPPISCDGWTAPSGTLLLGEVQRGEVGAWPGGVTRTCDTANFVYCFEP